MFIPQFRGVSEGTDLLLQGVCRGNEEFIIEELSRKGKPFPVIGKVRGQVEAGLMALSPKEHGNERCRGALSLASGYVNRLKILLRIADVGKKIFHPLQSYVSDETRS